MPGPPFELLLRASGRRPLPKYGVVLGGWSLEQWHASGLTGWRYNRYEPNPSHAWTRTYGGYTPNEWAEWQELQERNDLKHEGGLDPQRDTQCSGSLVPGASDPDTGDRK